MKPTTITIAFLLLISFAVQGQTAKIGTKKYLEEKRGFKDIILGDDIATIKDKISTTADTTQKGNGIIFYDLIDDSYLSIGDNIKLKKIMVGVFDNKIANIFLMFDKAYGEDIRRTYGQAYGMYSLRPNQFMDEYIWQAKSIVVILNYDGTGDGNSLFIDQNIEDQITKSRNEKAKSAASNL